MFQSITYNTGDDFLAGCKSFLMEKEIANNLPLGIAPRLKEKNILFSINHRTANKGKR